MSYSIESLCIKCKVRTAYIPTKMFNTFDPTTRTIKLEPGYAVLCQVCEKSDIPKTDEPVSANYNIEITGAKSSELSKIKAKVMRVLDKFKCEKDIDNYSIESEYNHNCYRVKQ